MTLVEIHAQVSRVAEGLLDRVIHALVEDAADEALHCFQQVKRFGMGGMLRVGITSLTWKSRWRVITYYRRLLKSSSCIKHWPVTFRLLRRRRFPNYTTRYPWRMPGVRGTRTYRGTLITSRGYWLKVGGRLALSLCVSGNQRKKLVQKRRAESRNQREKAPHVLPRRSGRLSRAWFVNYLGV